MSCIEPGMVEALRNHVLKETDGGPFARIFRMGEPGTRIMSVDLIFAANRIFISGDIMITDDRGVISDLGYGLDWFARGNGEYYLAEKFLRKRHVPKLARAWMREKAEEIRGSSEDWELSEEDRDRANLLESESTGGDDCGACRSPDAMWELFEELGWVMDDGCPGFDYEPSEVGWLAAIQQKFAELFAKLQEEQKT